MKFMELRQPKMLELPNEIIFHISLFIDNYYNISLMTGKCLPNSNILYKLADILFNKSSSFSTNAQLVRQKRGKKKCYIVDRRSKTQFCN